MSVIFSAADAGFAPPKPASQYHINVRKRGKLHVLFNREEPAGDRLVKHNGFPLEDTGLDPLCAWGSYKTQAAADIAADKLQRYLDHPPKK